jgi:DNA-binding NarL/FixJ family response regulator
MRVALADKDYLVVEALASVLSSESDISITGVYTSGRTLLRGLDVRKSDVVVLDPTGLSAMGIRLLRTIGAAHPETNLIVLTANQGERYLMEAVRAGVRGYLSKSAGVAEVVHAIRTAHEGLAVLGPKETTQLMEAFVRQQQAETGLTPRQHELLSGIVQGKTDREIARDLCLAEKTVKNYMKGVFCALGVRNRTDAAVRALQLDLVSEREWIPFQLRPEMQQIS